MKIFSAFKNPSITYGITVNNEITEIGNLLRTLLSLKDKDDEIIVLQDITNADKGVTDLLASFGNALVRMEGVLAGDFASFKNQLITRMSKEYLFQLDADEMITPKLIKKLKRTLKKYPDFDCFVIPRINTVNGLSETDLKKWNWTKNEKGYINYPDYQQRIFKNNGKIFWKNKVHEELYGFSKQYILPADTEDYCLLHHKTIAKQLQQNTFYESVE